MAQRKSTKKAAKAKPAPKPAPLPKCPRDARHPALVPERGMLMCPVCRHAQHRR